MSENLDLSFKERLPIEDISWLGIGKHLGSVVQASIPQEAISQTELRLDYTTIPIEYIDDYFKGVSSFGCFFRSIKEYYELSTKNIFGTQSRATEIDVNNLLKYLESLTYEADIQFLRISPGHQLRDHVMSCFRSKRDEWRESLYQNLLSRDENIKYRQAKIRLSRDLKKFERDLLGDYMFKGYENCHKLGIADENFGDIIHISGILADDIVPVKKFETWLESAKFERYYRMMRKGSGLVCATKITSERTIQHVNAWDLSDIDHYRANLSMGVLINLLGAMPALVR